MKISLYAEANISEVWLVDVNQEIVKVYRHPLQRIYQDVQQLINNQVFSILAVPDLNINVSEIF